MIQTATAAMRRGARSDAEAFQYIIDTIYERSGIRLHEGKESLIQARLGKRLRQLEIQTLSEYCDLLRTGNADQEFEYLVNALTTNFTSFLREKDHFAFLINHALPEVLPASEKRFHIWSAACSSGEEPFTLAFYLSEHYPAISGWEWKITASDISTKVLNAAKSGLYAEDRISSLPPEWRRKYFQKGIGKWAGHVRVKRTVAEHIEFRQINLIGSYDHPHSFPVIFCRNVMIYFDRPTQERLVNQMCRHLSPKGFLLIGHSESLNGLQLPLRCIRPSIYQKTS
jgi:chemotaxis protein methyltransferase CheR